MIVIAGTRRARTLCVLVLGLVLLATVSVEAAHASTIHACVKPKSGATRIVSAKAKCHHGEQRLSWSTTGPRGAQGPAGLQGPIGLRGNEGKAGPNGAGAVFFAAGGGIELKEAEPGGAVVATKTLPPGSYMIGAKSDLIAESAKAGFEDALCFLEDRPGTTNTGEAELLDFAAWTTQLVEKEAGDFLGEAALPMQGTLTSSVTSTLSVICSVDDESPGTKAHVVLAQLQALAVTSIG